MDFNDDCIIFVFVFSRIVVEDLGFYEYVLDWIFVDEGFDEDIFD